MDKLKPIYSMVDELSRLEARYLILMMLRNWRNIGLTKADLVKLQGRLQILIDHEEVKNGMGNDR